MNFATGFVSAVQSTLECATLSVDYGAWIRPSYVLSEVIVLNLLGRYADRNFSIRDNYGQLLLCVWQVQA